MKISFVMGLFCFLFGCLSPCFGKHLDFKYVVEHGILWEENLPKLITLKSFQEEIRMSKTITLPLKIKVTSDGKGTMEIGNVLLYIYGSNTLVCYEDEMLTVDFVDTNENGIKEMLIHGFVNYTSEGSNIIVGRDNVLFIYRYDVAKKKFILNYKRAFFDLEKEFGNFSRKDIPPKCDHLEKIDATWDMKDVGADSKDFQFEASKKQKEKKYLKEEKQKEKGQKRSLVKSSEVFEKLLQIDYSNITTRNLFSFKGKPFEVVVKNKILYDKRVKNKNLCEVVILDDTKLTARCDSDEVWLYNHPKYPRVKLGFCISKGLVKKVKIFKSRAYEIKKNVKTLSPEAQATFKSLCENKKQAEAAKKVKKKQVVQGKWNGPEEGQKWIVDLGAEVQMIFVSIAAGSFRMGSNSDFSNEKPVHRVRLIKPFWMAKTEVTQAQWKQIMGNNPSHFKGDQNPVEQVSWNDAMMFCKKLTEREQKVGHLPKGWIYTLPTEAQWEYTCRAGTMGKYVGNLSAKAWYNLNSGDKTHPVGTKKTNAWGLCDMRGNVWEWCLDRYGKYPSGSVTDPSGAHSGLYQVYRGGGWEDTDSECRSAIRCYYSSKALSNYLGFRPVVLQR